MSTNRIPSGGYFFILFAGRTGSSYVVSCLNSHSAALCYGEMFKGEKLKFQEELMLRLREGIPLDDFTKSALPARYVHEQTQAARALQQVGFKTKLGDIPDREAFTRTVREMGFKVIFLTRRNVIKHALSSINCKRLHSLHGIFNAVVPEQVQGPLEVDVPALLEAARSMENSHLRIAEYIEHLGLTNTTMYYESLLSDRGAFFTELFGFLGLEEEEVSGKIYKNTPDSLRSAILNFDEVQSSLRGTRYEQFLTD